MALPARYRNLQDYIEALEGERRKILVFSRELPLCLELITQVIEIRRREMAGDDYFGEVPALEEFIPLKRSSSSSGNEKSHKVASDSKPDWPRSVQLWAPAVAVETSPVESSKPRKPVAKMGGAFRRFEKEKLCRPPMAEILESSTTTENISAARKQRRCWSPELHRKFLCALERLGGCQSATPKQIRELMKVERLTNDEQLKRTIKLRVELAGCDRNISNKEKWILWNIMMKYRLHTTQPSTKIQSSSYINPQIPSQLVLVGGIWVPPPDYRVMVTAAEQSSAAFNGTYSSVPSMALESGLSQEKQDKQQKQLNILPSKPSQSFEDDTNLADELATKSDSCTMSSTSQTTTLPLL